MRRSIAILSSASLAWNPRVLKEAQALTRGDFRVTVLGANEDASGLLRDQRLAATHGFNYISVAPSFDKKIYTWFRRNWCRLRYRFGRALYHRIGYAGPWQAGLYAPELESAARRVSADYLILHLEAALLMGERLLRDGIPVGLDMEDWYSEDLPASSRVSRPIRLLCAAERKMLGAAAHVTCPSQAMSQELAKHYGSERVPTAIYNSFSWRDRESVDALRLDRGTSENPSIYWFSQTLGPGRGLEDLLAALPLIERRVDVHLRGECVPDFAVWLTRSIPRNHRDWVKVHPRVPLEELPSRIAEHDIGFAGEMLYSRSRDLTITNKILQYLLGGLAIVASDTAGQREVAELANGAILLYPSGDTYALAHQINSLLSNAERLHLARQAAVRAAERQFCWEVDERRLVALVRAAVDGATPS